MAMAMAMAQAMAMAMVMAMAMAQCTRASHPVSKDPIRNNVALRASLHPRPLCCSSPDYFSTLDSSIVGRRLQRFTTNV